MRDTLVVLLAQAAGHVWRQQASQDVGHSKGISTAGTAGRRKVDTRGMGGGQRPHLAGFSKLLDGTQPLACVQQGLGDICSLESHQSLRLPNLLTLRITFRLSRNAILWGF